MNLRASGSGFLRTRLPNKRLQQPGGFLWIECCCPELRPRCWSAGQLSLETLSRMSIGWTSEWRKFTNEKHNRYIKRELDWELERHPDHPLAVADYELVGAKNLYNDFIFYLPEEQKFGHVHLTWGAMLEPPCIMIGSEDEVSAYIRECTESG